MRAAFRLFDDEGKVRAAWAQACSTDADARACLQQGTITFKNLKRVAKELGENMTDEELQEMIDEADRDGDGEVNEEARAALLRLARGGEGLTCAVARLQEFIRIMRKTALARRAAACVCAPAG